MATTMMTRGTTTIDRFVGWTMIAGLALALVQYGQTLALPAHFV